MLNIIFMAEYKNEYQINLASIGVFELKLRWFLCHILTHS